MKKKKVAANRNGMPCTKCSGKTEVKRTVSNLGHNIIRTRVCLSCRNAYDTIERLLHQDERARIRAVVCEVLEVEQSRIKPKS